MEAMCAPRLMRLLRAVVCAGCWSAWVEGAGQTQGLIPCLCRLFDQGMKVALVLLELRPQDAGRMPPYHPS